jgi:hypothetical protein
MISVLLLGLTLMYVAIAVRTLSAPNFPGAQNVWPVVAGFAAVIVCAVAVGLWGSTIVRRWFASAVGVVAAGLLFAIMIGSGSGRSISVIVLLALVGIALGRRLLRWMLPGVPSSLLTGVLLPVALALGVFSLATLVLGLAGVLYAWFVWALIVVLVVLARQDLRVMLGEARAARHHVQATFDTVLASPFGLPLLTLMCGWGVLVLIESVAPEIQYDALNYHLALPHLYVQQAAFTTTPYMAHSWFAQGAEMDFTLALVLGDMTAAKLVSLAFLVLGVLATFVEGRHLFGTRAGVLAAVLFGTTPLIAWGGTTAYVDGVAACYCLLCLITMQRWLASRQSGWLVVAGLLGGCAMSAKLNSALFLVPIGLVFLAAEMRARPTAARLARDTLSFGIALILFGAPWPVLRYLETGNPVFPFMNAIFRSPLWPPVNETFNFGSFGVGTRPADLVQLPWLLTVSSQRFVEAMPPSIVGVLLLAVLLCILRRDLSRRAPLVTWTLVCFSVLWVLSAQYLRYYVPALALDAILVGALLGAPVPPSLRSRLFTRLGGPQLGALLVLVWALASVPSFAASYWMIPERIPFGVAFGRESRSDYLSRVLPAYDALSFINSASKTGDRIFAVGPGEYRLYSDIPMETSNIGTPTLLALIEAHEDDQARLLLEQHGFTFLLLDRANVLPPFIQGMYILQAPFLQRNERLVFARNNFEVYQLRDEALPAGNASSGWTPELLVNSGFEDVGTNPPPGWSGEGSIVSPGHTGQHAAHVAVGQGFAQSLRVSPGAIFRLTESARATEPGSTVRLQINWLDDAGTFLSVSSNVFDATPDWTEHELLATAPDHAGNAVVYIVAQQGSVDVDDCSLVRRL